MLLTENSKPKARIYIPGEATVAEQQAAQVLQKYVYSVSGASLSIEKETAVVSRTMGIFIGHTTFARKEAPSSIPGNDGFILQGIGNNLVLCGTGNKGTLYAVYTFIEKYLNCYKWDAGPAMITRNPTISIPAVINEKEAPVFRYREVYLPPAFDDEYLDWHRLHRFESLWGLWGHSFFKLLSPAVYFNDHPEYFSLINGKRQPVQLCLSNEAVVDLVAAGMENAMKQNPNAVYWSVSPNDEAQYCQCDQCSSIDNTEGGPQGSLIHFVNKIAARFPAKQITTLAYSYYARAPRNIKPLSNVTILLSSIDVYRSLPLSTEPTASAFRRNLADWKEKTKQIFVWDYCTQFTNYLTPFPVALTFQNSFRYLQQQDVSGIFEQGSGDTYSDMPELNAYLLSKLLWNPGADYEKLLSEFLQAYYGNASSIVRDYLLLMQQQVREHNTRLDIYGNPVNNHKDYLSPANMDTYSRLMDQAEALVENDSLSLQRIRLLRVGHDYVYLQQAKFFGKDNHGIFEKDIAGSYSHKLTLPKKVAQFVTASVAAGVKKLAEEGVAPAQYHAEWKNILAKPHRKNLASDARLTLRYPFIPEYPAKNELTLIDETPGYRDFSYNWLCFDKTPMELVLDMAAKKQVNTVSVRFLEDARHWFFRPSEIYVEVSADGVVYEMAGATTQQLPDESWLVQAPVYIFQVKKEIRFVRLKAQPQPALPGWRTHPFKNPLIACDEVWVE